MPAGMMRRILAAPDLTRETLGNTVLVQLGRGAAPAPLAGSPLPRDGWRVEASDPGAELVVDGDLATHWTAPIVDHASFLRVDLGKEQRVMGVRLRLGMHFREYPEAWEVWGSSDGVAWDRLGGSRPTMPPFASYLRDHRAVDLDLPLRPADVRLLEVRVPAENALVFLVGHGRGTWGVHELDILGP
jgi:hypothetical protein